MIRTLFIGLNYIGILLIGIFQETPVTITHNPPASMSPGEEVMVRVEIDKSDVSGFAKYQVTLGEGLRAEAVESAGASFSFSDGKAKFIWMSLPTESNFSLKYRLIAEPNASGNAELESRFSYIYENERKNFDLPDHTISLGGEDVPVTADEGSEEDEDASVTSEASAERLITPAGVNQWKVTVNIDKEAISGFAKVEETIPEGYTAIDLTSGSAVFSSENETIKYIWYDIPQNATVTVTYKLLPVLALDGEAPVITGDFSYLQNEVTVTIPILGGYTEDLAEMPKDTLGADVVDVPADEQPSEELAETTPPEEPEKEFEPETVEEPEPEAEPAEEPVAEETPQSEEESPEIEPFAEKDETARAEDTPPKKSITDANIVDVPEPEEGIWYRVQIAAGKNNLKREVFAKLYNFEEGYKLEYIDPWFKYTTGHHAVYKAARNDRERITRKYEKFQGPFVTAYNDGERITVQEALMITDQKWVP